MGIINEREDQFPICIEPEDCSFLVDSFSSLKELAEELEKVDKESGMFHTHPIAHENHLRRLTNRSYMGAIEKILKKRDYKDKSTFFVASPTYIDGYQVYTVLSFENQALRRHYSLTKDCESWHSRFPICKSFIESVAKVFLKECTDKLKDPVYGFSNLRASEELLREAGQKMMETPAWAGNDIYDVYGLYSASNQIASMKYEGAIGIGEMIIAAKDHQNVKLTLELANPISIQNHRLVRKFLELSNNSTSIVSDAAFIYGLGELRGGYNPNDESLFVIKFLDHHTALERKIAGRA